MLKSSDGKIAQKRSNNDFYPTPKCLVWELLKTGELNDCKKILEPACGDYAISNVLIENGFDVVSRDLKYGDDFLADEYSGQEYDCIFTNPPYHLWDDFVRKCKLVNTKKFILNGKLNFFGSHSRTKNNIWENLKKIYVFDRQIAYDGEFREDGKAKAGCLITGWFVWDRDYKGLPTIEVLDIDKYILRKEKK